MARELRLTRVATYQRLTDLGLPTIPYVAASLDAFLANPRSFIDRLKCSSIRAIVEHKEGAWDRPVLRRTQPALESLAEDIRNSLGDIEPVAYQVLLKEYIPDAIQGAVFAYTDGGLVGEFALPESSSIQLGGTPDFRMWRDPWTQCFRYSFEDPSMRTCLYRALAAFPSTGEGRDRVFRPGYYELILARRPDESVRKVYFDDFREGEGFVF